MITRLLKNGATATAANPERSSFVPYSDTKDDRTLGKVAPDRAAELARRGAALAQAAEAAERADGAAEQAVEAPR